MIQKIEQLRIIHKVTKKELCKGIISVSTYNKYLTNSTNVGFNKVQELAFRLGYDIRLTVI